MKKNIKKKLFNVNMIFLFLGAVNVYAADTTLGVEITGETVLDVVTTIKANVKVNLTDTTTSSAYLNIVNNGNVPVQAKITNISSLTEGAPSNFINADENNSMKNAGINDTTSKIGFQITNYRANFIDQNIQPDTEIDLGVINAGGFGKGATTGEPITLSNGDVIDNFDYLYSDNGSEGRSIFEIIPYVGYAWPSSNQNFQYAITVVFSLSETTSESGSYFNKDAFPGISTVDYKITPSRHSQLGKTYMLGTMIYDKTKLEDGVTGYRFSSATRAITIALEDGTSYYNKTLDFPNAVTATVELDDSNYVYQYVAIPIDMSDIPLES